MENIWTNIAGESQEIYIYDITYDCNIFCTIKKRKVKLYKLEYNNNKLILSSLNKKYIYELTYVPDRSNEFIYYFECKNIGGNNDLTMTIYLETNNIFYTCKFKDLKPRITTNYVYQAYTRTYTNTINEYYGDYRDLYIIKPPILNPPPYQ
jgi:hypothetical protein